MTNNKENLTEQGISPRPGPETLAEAEYEIQTLRKEMGKGDTIQETEQYWGNTDIEEIYGRIIDWKAETK